MSTKKNEKQVINLQVTDGLAVTVIPDLNHEFLMTTKDVAVGYGVSEGNIRNHLHRNKDEFQEKKHYASAVCFSNSKLNAVHNKVYWTKRGIVRLGFFIKSKQAKLFRDWAEDLVLEKLQPQQKQLFAAPVKALPEKRTRANRLTPQRMVSIMADVCRINDDEVRMSLVNKLTGGQ